MTVPPKVKQAVLSVFTSSTAKGNPAGVVITPTRLNFAERANLGRQLGTDTPATATAFISHPSVFKSTVDLTSPRPIISWNRYSGQPLPLCGHGTAAGVQYLLQNVLNNTSEVTFDYYFGDTAEDETLKGTITGLKDGSKFGIDLPASLPGREVTQEEWREVEEVFCEACGISPVQIVRMVASPSGYNGEGLEMNVTIEIEEGIDLQAMKPDFDKLATIQPFRGIWVVSKWPEQESRDSAFRSRIFFPKTGLLEDLACGSAHTFIVPWWVSTYPEACETLREGEGYRVPVDQLSSAGAKMEIVWNGKWREDGGRTVLMGEGVVLQES